MISENDGKFDHYISQLALELTKKVKCKILKNIDFFNEHIERKIHLSIVAVESEDFGHSLFIFDSRYWTSD